MKQQSDHQCECGSWYHDNGICQCGKNVVVPQSFYTGNVTRYDPTKRGPRGAGWNKAQHKVIWN